MQKSTDVLGETLVELMDMLTQMMKEIDLEKYSSSIEDNNKARKKRLAKEARERRMDTQNQIKK